ncbi:hypothetical protein Tco_0503349 [Tanacetum coccineum]
MVKLTTFAVRCKAYGGEPTVNLLRVFLNLGPASDWLTLSNRGSADVPKVIPDAAMKLVYSNDLGVLIAKLVRSSIIYGRCQAFKEVAAMKEPFILEKMSGYRPLSKEEYDQDGDALANASYPFLAEYVVNPYASLTQLLSKKPPSLRPILF